MFSYLQAIAQAKKKNNLASSYLISGTVNATLLALLVIPSTVFLSNLQFTILVLELIVVVISLLTNLYMGEILIKDTDKKKYGALIAVVGLQSFVNKYWLGTRLYSILSVAIVTVNMISIGWIGQAVFFILASALTISTLYNFLDQLPEFVAKLNINEDDITV